ncbi:pentapeptide repeat-containing protein [Actinophytocola sp. NPDC049390]|uniref:pentapeptide repeat-containing protein n=1 Tax=Actinophytocola sp. NPDC049390 TaxID=3363894 RepID=UPI003787FF93
MDEPLLRAALTARERRLRHAWRRRAAVWALVALAVAATGWQLVRLGMVPSWTVVGRWWPALVALAALVVAGVLWSRTRSSPTPLTGEGRWSRIGGMVTTVTAVGALVFTAISLEATRDQIDVAREGQITDRFTRAIDQLSAEGSSNMHRRLGGIYALERIAVDSARDQATMVEVLSAFLRSTSPRAPGKPCGETRADVAAAFAVLARRDVSSDPRSQVIDLRNLCLRKVRAVRGDVSRMSMIGSDLTGANFAEARFGLTSLSRATLSGVYLFAADMTAGFVWADDADFTGAYLGYAKLGSTEFSGSTFVGANFEGTDMGHADFTGANLTDATHNPRTRAAGARKGGTTGAWW